MVGDGVTDILAGYAAGTRTIFIGTMKCYFCKYFEKRKVFPDFIARDLWEATHIIGNIDAGNLKTVIPFMPPWHSISNTLAGGDK